MKISTTFVEIIEVNNGRINHMLFSSRIIKIYDNGILSNTQIRIELGKSH